MKSRFRIELVLVALVCIGPLIAAYVLYFYGEPGALPRLHNPDRLLLQPAVPLPPVEGVGASGAELESVWDGSTWTLFLARTARCGETCRRDLVRLRQVHAALGRDQSRVQRVYVGPDADEIAGSGLAAAGADLGRGSAGDLLELLESVGAAPGEHGRIYVADPHGNLVLSYPADAEQEGLLDDLERVLDVSRIG